MPDALPPALARLLPDIDRIAVVSIPMTTRFRGIDHREALLFHGPAGWAEFSPFLEYGVPEASAWLRSALEAATLPYPEPQRTAVPINATIPVVGPAAARELSASFGATTAKVKVADPRSSHEGDLERIAAVRDAMGPSAAIRVDANMAWGVDEAVTKIRDLDRAAAGLEYVEQPCRSVLELAEVRRRVTVPIAADESVRRAGDPLAVARAGAADLLVMKVQPLGGVRNVLRLADEAGLPVVISSALETSVGLSAGLACASALPALPFACGLGTARLLAGDVTHSPLTSGTGTLPVGRIDVHEDLLSAHRTGDEATRRWHRRLADCLEYLGREQGPATVG